MHSVVIISLSAINGKLVNFIKASAENILILLVAFVQNFIFDRIETSEKHVISIIRKTKMVWVVPCNTIDR